MQQNIITGLFVVVGFAIAGSLFSATGANGKVPDTSQEDFNDSLAVVQPIVQQKHPNGYMAQSCSGIQWPGWEGFPTQDCKYSPSGESDSIRIILLDPDSERLARWVTSACLVAETNDLIHCARLLIERIRSQSSGHFPIAGIVMEDGKQYPFRDGVTVSVAGVENGTSRPPTDDEIEAVISGVVKKVYKYARLQGTMREEYIGYVGTKLQERPLKVNGLAWRTAIRKLYQEAWNSDSYLLMDVWAWKNRSKLSR